MTVIQFILAVVGLLGCLWAVNTYIAEAGIKLFGSILLIILLVVVILSFCNVLPLLAQGAIREDNVAPGAITDLVVAPFGGDGWRVEFVCPGDDSFTGQSYEFQARYSTQGPIASQNAWEVALFAPQWSGWQSLARVGGQPVSLELTQNPEPGIQKWLAVRFRDEAGNVATLSNSPSWDGAQ